MIVCSANSPTRKIVFEGDSRMAQYNNGTDPQQFVPNLVYSNCIASYPNARLGMHSFARGGRTMTQILADAPTVIVPFVKTGDIIILWEITNEMAANGTTPQACFDMIQDYYDIVHPLGVQLILCTETARDKAGDDANLLTDIQAVNTLIRNAGTSIAEIICDLGADPFFDTRADCSNATYYDSDKLHLTVTGSTLAATLITDAVTPLL